MDLTISTIIGDFILIAGSFLLLIFLVKKYAWGNISSILDERAEKISSDIDGAEEARKKAEELANQREAELAGSRTEAKLEAGRLKEKANQEIAQNKAEALQSVKGEVADLTVSLTGKIISQNLDSHAHKELIDQYIDQLGEA